MFCLHVYLGTIWSPGPHRDQKRASLEQEFYRFWVTMWVTRCRSNLSPLSHLSCAPEREHSVTLSPAHVHALTFAETHSCSVVSGGHETQPGCAMCGHHVLIHRHLLITELPRAVQPCTELLEHVQNPHANDLLDVGHRRINLV